MDAGYSEIGKRGKVFACSSVGMFLTIMPDLLAAICTATDCGCNWTQATVFELPNIVIRSTILRADRGNIRSETIALTKLGKKIAYPENSEDEREGHFRAFVTVDVDEFIEIFDGNLRALNINPKEALLYIPFPAGNEDNSSTSGEKSKDR